VLKNLLFGESIGVLITRSYAYFHKSIETTILTNPKKNLDSKDRNCIFGEFFEVISSKFN